MPERLLASDPRVEDIEARELERQKTLVLNLQIWSQNMRSWNTNSMALLTDANDAHIDVLLLQETNINPISIAAMMNKAHRYGWQAVHVPPTSKARGGVAVLVRPPLAIVELQRFESEQGKFLLVECHGLQEAILLGSLYRHSSDAQFHVPQTLCHILATRGGAQWVVGMDANDDMVNGAVAGQLQHIGGICHGFACHNTSTVPIDATWSSVNTSGLHFEIDGPGDHSIAQTNLHLCRKQRARSQLRF